MKMIDTHQKKLSALDNKTQLKSLFKNLTPWI